METRKPSDPGDFIEHALKCLEAGRSLRHTFDDGSRIHIDRPLPFLCVHRRSSDRPQRAAEQIAVANASYLITEDIAATASLIDAVASMLAPMAA